MAQTMPRVSAGADREAEAARAVAGRVLPERGRQEMGDGPHGIILLGFVLAHMIGNLKLYLSKDEIDLYGEALRNMPGHLLPRTVLLWSIRIVLIARVRLPHPLGDRASRASTARPGPPRPLPVEARLCGRRLRVADDALDRHHLSWRS